MGYAVVALLAVMAAYFGINVTTTTNKAFQEVAKETLPKIEALERMRSAGRTLVRATRARINAAPQDLPVEEQEVYESRQEYSLPSEAMRT